MLLTTAPAFAQERKADPDEIQKAQKERLRESRREEPTVDWESEYKDFLKKNPSVAEAVESGRIFKDKVMAGVKARAGESKEAKLKAMYEKMVKENPEIKERGITFEQLHPRLEHMLREELATGGNKKEGGDQWERKYEELLRQYPTLIEDTRVHGLSKDNVLWMLKHGELNLDESDKEAQRARAKKAYKAPLKIMTDAKKLNDKQASELYETVFPSDTDWDAKYEAFLKENPGVAKAVESGKMTREKVIAGTKARESEKEPTEEEQLDALYQKLLREDRTLGRTPKEQLMPRLKEMLKRGEGKNLRPEKSFRQRRTTHGLYFFGLIESGQVERCDQDLKRVHDVESIEIVRQDGPKELKRERPGRKEERARAERVRERERAERRRDR